MKQTTAFHHFLIVAFIKGQQHKCVFHTLKEKGSYSLRIRKCGCMLQPDLNLLLLSTTTFSIEETQDNKSVIINDKSQKSLLKNLQLNSLFWFFKKLCISNT